MPSSTTPGSTMRRPSSSPMRNGAGKFLKSTSWLRFASLRSSCRCSQYNERNSVKSQDCEHRILGKLTGPAVHPVLQASKFALAGMSESMFYDLGPLDVHVVLASPGSQRRRCWPRPHAQVRKVWKE